MEWGEIIGSVATVGSVASAAFFKVKASNIVKEVGEAVGASKKTIANATKAMADGKIDTDELKQTTEDIKGALDEIEDVIAIALSFGGFFGKKK